MNKLVGWLVILIALNLLIGLLTPSTWADIEPIITLILVAVIGISIVAKK